MIIWPPNTISIRGITNWQMVTADDEVQLDAKVAVLVGEGWLADTEKLWTVTNQTFQRLCVKPALNP